MPTAFEMLVTCTIALAKCDHFSFELAHRRTDFRSEVP